MRARDNREMNALAQRVGLELPSPVEIKAYYSDENEFFDFDLDDGDGDPLHPHKDIEGRLRRLPSKPRFAPLRPSDPDYDLALTHVAWAGLSVPKEIYHREWHIGSDVVVFFAGRVQDSYCFELELRPNS